MMKIVDFTKEHVNQALNIAKENYENEQRYIDILPSINEFSDFDFTSLIKNKLGVAAFDGEKMVGYLCCFDSYKNAFETTNDIGVWSPLYGNGIIECNHKNVFAQMYQEAAKKWVGLGITNHAITFYAHNNSVQNQLYRYGFGLRCIDAIRSMRKIETKEKAEFYFSELENNEFHLIYPMRLFLGDHLRSSPMFLRYEEKAYEAGDEDRFAKWEIQKKSRYFVAKNGEKIIAYIKVSEKGENFISEVNYMKHIQGAYCLPEYRGQGIVQNILIYLIKALKNENNQLLGVDFESFNPTASGFWLKYFTEYTQSVVRRVDDRFIK